MNQQGKKTVGVVGLGLIGGSFLKAYKESGDWCVYGYDINHKITGLAQLAEDMDAELSEANIGECDLLLLALYPTAAIDYLTKMAPSISEYTIVMDCCGTKRLICEVGFELADQFGFTFVGGHPMAGKHFSGYRYATPDLYDGTSMIIVPPIYDDITLLDLVRQLLLPAHFAHLTVTTAEKHDEMIAYTSQMAHVVSNAFVKSPAAQKHKGFSAGSFKDLTRVAWLSEELWTELFLENRDNLLNELRLFLANLMEYEDAIERNDADKLMSLLREGKDAKARTEQTK